MDLFIRLYAQLHFTTRGRKKIFDSHKISFHFSLDFSPEFL